MSFLVMLFTFLNKNNDLDLFLIFKNYFSYAFSEKIGKIGTWILLGYIFSHLIDELNLININDIKFNKNTLFIAIFLLNFISLILAGLLFFEIVLIMFLSLIKKIKQKINSKISWMCLSLFLISIALGHIFVFPSVGPSIIIEKLNIEIISIKIYTTIFLFIFNIFIIMHIFLFLFKNKLLIKNNLNLNEQTHPILLLKYFLFLIPFFSIAIFKFLNLKYKKNIVFYILSEPLSFFVIFIAFLYFLLAIKNIKNKSKYNYNSLNNKLNSAGNIILVICSTSLLSFALQNTNIITMLSTSLIHKKEHLIFLAFAFSLFLRVSIGSATISFLITFSLLEKFIIFNTSYSLKYVGIILSIGAGSSSVSHINDTGFWLINKTFGLNLKETFKIWTIPLFFVSLIIFFISIILFYSGKAY
ncbi:DsdX permease [Mesomycoplasma neurolyticum]|uniref:DsdX permease n=2 Tax=Mesomycoplasma neurolyticum TaxID=2120 RepID=A0A449A5X2_9BACT|nr:DsdX permease [Mesomycoplasma neurolyticum]